MQIKTRFCIIRILLTLIIVMTEHYNNWMADSRKGPENIHSYNHYMLLRSNKHSFYVSKTCIWRNTCIGNIIQSILFCLSSITRFYNQISILFTFLKQVSNVIRVLVISFKVFYFVFQESAGSVWRTRPKFIGLSFSSSFCNFLRQSKSEKGSRNWLTRYKAYLSYQ
jgi:hypothetical protein